MSQIDDFSEDTVSRRRFLQFVGASIALSGIASCTKMPPEKIIPYIIAPENLIPGQPQYFATAYQLSGYSKGVLAESHEGRPTKLEGNPKHPTNQGKSDIFMQAELLQLYDPDRVKTVTHLGEISTWEEFTQTILVEKSKWDTNQGEGVRILTGHATSPTLLEDFRKFFKLYPKARIHEYEPINDRMVRTATKAVFGQELIPQYDLSRAKVVLSVDADFLGPGPGQEVYARDFTAARKSVRATHTTATPTTKKHDKESSFNRLYVIETSISTTGAYADHRWSVRPSQLLDTLLTLSNLIGMRSISKPNANPNPETSTWLQSIAEDLKAHSGSSLILAGPQSEAAIQALAFAINQHLGNLGKTLRFTRPFESTTNLTPKSQSHTLLELSEDMAIGKVTSLLILGGNPVYDAPATLRFKERLNLVPLIIRFGMYTDETAYHSHWVLPESHFLEAWGDGRSIDGTVTLQQPLISPLYATRSGIEVFSILNGDLGRTGADAVRNYWQSQFSDQRLQEGFLVTPPLPHVIPSFIRGWESTVTSPVHKTQSKSVQSPPKNILEAVFKPDPTIWDGRYSNNGWLQELPKPILQLTWDNAVVISPETAKILDLEDEDEVELKIENHLERAPILQVPGHANGTATLYLGYGRTRAGRVGSNHGYNAYALQDHRSPWFATALEIRKTGNKLELATTHMHSNMEGRDLVIHSELETFRKHPSTIVSNELKTTQPTILAEYPYNEEAWAMVIDLTACIGCNTCSIACQAENNIPFVGKDQVRRAREMHWIRIDRYFHGDKVNPKIYFQPVPCMHCENAPCEQVCPTEATNHSTEGLNQMIYNRCVGTRYCSNNCPYKVRRFNFLKYSNYNVTSKNNNILLMYNPDVTVRSRGVMEKCTYCIQRIQEVRIQSELKDRAIKDGEILTACQQACPTEAIIFGNQNDAKSQVAQLQALPHDYKLLNELGTKPRTTYLALIRNPNPKLEAGDIS